MFRVNPYKDEETLAAINRFLNRMQQRSVPRCLVQRIEAMSPFKQQTLEVIRVELIRLARLLDAVQLAVKKSAMEARIEAVLQQLLSADQQHGKRIALLEKEVSHLREVLLRYEKNYPDSFYCPLSHELMRDPVMFRQGSGHSYERSELEAWIAYCQRQHNGRILDPMTQLVVDGETITNYALRDAIEAVCHASTAVREASTSSRSDEQSFASC